MKRPFIFLDEVTTGQDRVTAKMILELIKKVCVEHHIAVLIIIHQPGPDLAKYINTFVALGEDNDDDSHDTTSEQLNNGEIKPTKSGSMPGLKDKLSSSVLQVTSKRSDLSQNNPLVNLLYKDETEFEYENRFRGATFDKNTTDFDLVRDTFKLPTWVSVIFMMRRGVMRTWYDEFSFDLFWKAIVFDLCMWGLSWSWAYGMDSPHMLATTLAFCYWTFLGIDVAQTLNFGLLEDSYFLSRRDENLPLSLSNFYLLIGVQQT
eukprot:UN23928